MELNKIYGGKMEIVLPEYFPDNCSDSIVTDPPYGLRFMNKHWDYQVPTVEQWKEAYRVLKPGGFLLSFGGTRTYHRMVVNIEDAGFEIRDQIQWLYGSGFPKSLDISKSIDKQAGAERTNVIGKSKYEGRRPNKFGGGENGDTCYGDFNAQPEMPIYEAATDEAKEWEGWGTALKPANEPICVARKPVEGTVAENVLKWGTGGLNIDGCRIGTDELTSQDDPNKFKNFKEQDGRTPTEHEFLPKTTIGRFPANVILDEFMGVELDKQSGVSKSVIATNINRQQRSSNAVFNDKNNGLKNGSTLEEGYDDMGGASRFFYCPKPDNFERNKGLKNFKEVTPTDKTGRKEGSKGVSGSVEHGNSANPFANGGGISRNHHPTVKPIDLMRYLVRLVTKKGGIVLDPFCGSGTTLIAAKMELMNYIGIDMDETNVPLAEARVKLWNPDLYKPQTLF